MKGKTLSVMTDEALIALMRCVRVKSENLDIERKQIENEFQL